MNSHINVILALKQEDQVHFSRWSTVKPPILYGEKKKSVLKKRRGGAKRKEEKEEKEGKM